MITNYENQFDSFELTKNRFQKSEEPTKDYTSSYGFGRTMTLAAGQLYLICQKNPKRIRANIRNVGANQCLFSRDAFNSGNPNMSLNGGGAGTIPVPGENMEWKSRDNLWAISALGTTLEIDEEYGN